MGKVDSLDLHIFLKNPFFSFISQLSEQKTCLTVVIYSGSSFIKLTKSIGYSAENEIQQMHIVIESMYG